MIDFSAVKEISIPEGIVKKIVSAGITLWKASSYYKNWVPFSIDTDGSTFNGTGYIDGYRLSSSGSLKAQEGSVATGFIPATSGDVIRMSGATWGTSVDNGYTYILFYDSNFTKLANVNRFKLANETNGISNVSSNIDTANSSIMTDANGVTEFNIVFKEEVNYSYIRISATGVGADMIVTVNEEIPT